MPTTDIRWVETEAERQAIYAFRYQVIVEEMQLDIPGTDHERRAVIDPEDSTGHLLAAYKKGVVIGAVRVNFLRNGPVAPHRSLLGLDRLPVAERDATSISSRFLMPVLHRLGMGATRSSCPCTPRRTRHTRN